MKDRERRYTLVNKYLRDAFGAGMIGKRAKLSPSSMRLVKQEDEQVLATGDVLPFHEAELGFKGGTKTWLQTKVPLKDDDGEVEHILTVSFDITDRKEVEEELRESEARYRNLIEHAGDAVIIHVDGKIVLANPSAAEFIEVASPAEFVGKPMLTFVDPADHDVVKQRTRQNLGGDARVAPIEQSWRRIDGSRLDVEVSGSRVPWRGRWAVKVIARDITERKKTDTAMRMLQYAVDNAADAVYWMRPDGGFDYVNEAASRMVGCTRDELMRMRVWDLNPGIPKRDWPKRFAEIKKSSRRGGAREYRHRRKDGTLVSVEATTNYVRFGDQEFAFGFVRDVGDRKSTELALQTTQFAVDSASDALYLLRPDGGLAYANAAASRMLGYSRKQLEAMSVFDINPDHTPQTWKKAFAAYKDKRGPMVVAQRHQTKSGAIIPIEISANYFKFGEREGIFAFVRDIRERQAAENSLRQSEERYRSVVEQSPDPIIINCEDKIVFVNAAALNMMGFKDESEIIGKNAYLFLHPDSKQLVATLVRKARRKKTGQPPVDLKWTRPDGRVVEVEINDQFYRLGGQAGAPGYGPRHHRTKTNRASTRSDAVCDRSGFGCGLSG